MPEQHDSVLPEVVAGGVDRPRDIPSRTWRVVFDDNGGPGHVTNDEINGTEAVLQAAKLALLTHRFESLIFSPRYGSEISAIVAWTDAPPELVSSELERTVRETLSMDTRITDIGTIDITFDSDNAHISVPLQTVFGSGLLEATI